MSPRPPTSAVAVAAPGACTCGHGRTPPPPEVNTGPGRGAARSALGTPCTSAAEELQRLGHEQVVVLEDAAMAGVRIDAQLGVGQQLGEVE